MSKFFIALTLACCIAIASALPYSTVAEPFSDCEGSSNVKPVWEGEGTEVKRVENGVMFRVGEANNSVLVLHLYGTPYERGVAHGQLVKEIGNEMYDKFEVWMEKQAEDLIKDYVPAVIRRVIATKGVNAALKLVRLLTKPYTPAHFNEEMQGLADGLGIHVDRVINLMMFPELIRAACSMFGAWGDATKNVKNGAGGLIQLRALDWGVDNPLRLYPVVLVYHSQDTAKSANFALLSWTGFIGALTGYGHAAEKTSMGISEKKWYKEAPKEGILPSGYPWHFLLRDILEFDTNLAQAEARIAAAKKTASIFVGIGSGADNSFVAEEYGVKTNRIFNDTTPFPGYLPSAEQHPMMKNLVYIDKHTQPSTQWCMAKVLEKHYGNIDAAAAIDLVSTLQTGDIHLAVYDFAANDMYISVASTNKEGPVLMAYDNQFIRLDMTSLFDLKL